MNQQHCDLMTIAGTRPEVIKLSEFVKNFADRKHVYVYTGQHFSANLSDIFFSELGSTSDINIDCRSSDVSEMTARLGRLFKELKPLLVVVYGDTNSTLAGALAAKDNRIPIAHIEAGLRSFDLRMPEERNRIKVDRISDYLLCPTSLSTEFLKLEGILHGVEVTGNLIVDVCKKFSNRHCNPSIDLPVNVDDFILLTLHRAETVDDRATLGLVLNELSKVENDIVFPIHPRTRKNLALFDIALPKNVWPIEPQGYLNFLSLLTRCKLIMTDSGGVQEEASILGKPCVTLRHTTERWETILTGANRLFPLIHGDQQESLKPVIEEMISRKISQHPYGENVTDRTVESIKKILDRRSEATRHEVAA